jgi:hypothetical protein
MYEIENILLECVLNIFIIITIYFRGKGKKDRVDIKIMKTDLKSFDNCMYAGGEREQLEVIFLIPGRNEIGNK